MVEKNKILKTLEERVDKIGPMNCLVAGIALMGISYYLKYYRGVPDVVKGDYWKGIKYIISSIPVSLSSDVLLVAGGSVEVKKIITTYQNSAKKSRRARRLYSSWKRSPSLKDTSA